MHASDNRYEKEYLKALAGIYLVLCGCGFIHYLWMDLRAWRGSGPMSPAWHVQALCLLAVMSAAAFFVRPKIGHHGLLAVTLSTLCIGGTDLSSGAAAFHFVVLAILCLPRLNRTVAGTNPISKT